MTPSYPPLSNEPPAVIMSCHGPLSVLISSTDPSYKRFRRNVVSSSYQFRNVRAALALEILIGGYTISLSPGWIGSGEKIDVDEDQLRCSLGCQGTCPPVAELVQPSGNLD